MSNPGRSSSKKIGLPPGALVYVGPERTEKVKITVIDYSVNSFSEQTYDSVSECIKYREKKDTVSWINIDGIHSQEIMEDFGKHFGLHVLALEDIMNTRQRPKVEEFDDYLFVAIKMLGIDSGGTKMVAEHISLVLGHGWVITFQEREGDIFDVLRDRIRTSYGMIRERKADYLLYRFIDIIVDHYFFVTEFISEKTEALEERVLDEPSQENLQDIQHFKKQLVKMRRAASPLREAVATLQKDSNSLIQEKNLRYLTDVYEHIIQVSDFIETQRELLASIMDLYLSGISNKMNQIMKVLTIIATIFIPLTFIAGIYGMNFDNMPELHWENGYFMVWGLMIAIFIGMMFYFRRKKWL